MIKMLERMAGEIQQEAVTTKRVLERIPTDKLSWKPHPRSMSLGQLAMHVATIPGNISKLAQLEEFDVSEAKFDPPSPKDAKEILTALDASIKAAQEYLSGVNESAAMGTWRLKANGKEVFTYASCRVAPDDHAQSLVPPSRSVIGLPPLAGSPGSCDLWPQC
jgi:uncharacterized damage-inducible protein DinB